MKCKQKSLESVNRGVKKNNKHKNVNQNEE